MRSARHVPPPMAGHASVRGYSMVELMVSLAVGLLLSAVAAQLLQGQANEHRRLQTEQRLMQELRTAADVVTRDLRRAGYWGHAATAGAGANPYAAVAPGSAASNAVSFRYSRDGVENDSVDSNEQFGFRISGSTLQMLLGAGNWQSLTDPGTVNVTQFSVTPTEQRIDLQASCTQPCPAGSSACPPQLRVRSLQVRIVARASGDASVQRSLDSTVRLRNDTIVGACAA